MSDFDIYTEDGVEYKVCPDCFEPRKLTDFVDADDVMHDVCCFCSPPAAMPDTDFDSDEGARICDGFSMLGSED